MEPSAPDRPAPARRAPIVLIVLGSVLAVVGAGAFVFGSLMFGHRVADSTSGLLDLRSTVLLEVSSPGQGDVDLATGRYQLVAYGPDLVQRAKGRHDLNRLDAAPFVRPRITVTGPDGAALPVVDPGLTSLSHDARGGAVVIGQVSVGRAGTYRVQVAHGGRAVRSVGMRPAPDLGAAVDEAIGSGLVVLGGLVAGGLGMLVLIGGIVWFGVRGSRRGGPPPAPPPFIAG